MLKLACLVLLGWAAGIGRLYSAEGTIEVPFTLVKNVIVLQGKINGKGPFDMMLDSGVDPSVVDLQAAKAIGLKLVPTGEGGSGGGTEKNLTFESSFPVLELGGLRARNVEALGASLKEISDKLGRPVQAVLGYSLMKGRIIQIDYAKGMVRFLAQSPVVPVASTHRANITMLPFHYHDNILCDGILVNGKRLTANFDTGCNSAFQLNAAAVEKLGLQAVVAQSAVTESTGFNGAMHNRTGKVRNVSVGGISLDNPTVVFFARGTGQDNEGWELRIGEAFFKDYVLTFGFTKNVITLEKP